jgi:hypothetical protein
VVDPVRNIRDELERVRQVNAESLRCGQCSKDGKTNWGRSTDKIKRRFGRIKNGKRIRRGKIKHAWE